MTTTFPPVAGETYELRTPYGDVKVTAVGKTWVSIEILELLQTPSSKRPDPRIKLKHWAGKRQG